MNSRRSLCRNTKPSFRLSAGISLKDLELRHIIPASRHVSIDISESSQCGFQEYKLLDRLVEGNKPTAIISEVADDLNLDLVVISMEAIHSKHIDANVLAEFIPCPVILLPS